MSFLEKSKLTIQGIFAQREASGDVGIEIELEGEGPLGVECRGWQVHTENSLRGPGGRGHGGTEYVTRGALKEADVIPAVERLADTLNKNKCVIRGDAHRTSTHIHVNAQKMTILEVLGYITVFTAVEPLFLALCGDKRDGNSFCVSSYETGDLPEFFHNLCKQIEGWEPGYGLECQRGKYASLGTFRLHDLGTLEARCFPHSLNPLEIHQWCQWLLRIRSIVKNETDKSYRQIIKQGIHDPGILASRIFGEVPITNNTQEELVSFGSQEAYELTRLLKRYLNKKPEVKTKKSKVIPENAGLEAFTQGDVLREVQDFALDDFAEPQQEAPTTIRWQHAAAPIDWGNLPPQVVRRAR